MITGKSPRFYFLSLLLCGIAACAGIILYTGYRSAASHPDANYLALLREAYAAVAKNHVEKPDPKKLAKSMVDGMLAALDPHSAYLPPEPYHEMEVQMSGAFGGVGIELGTKESRLTVIAPIEDTPASRAGIQAGDHIWKIDTTLTKGMNISAAVKRMRGEKGTPVTLSILRGDAPKPLVFNLVRDTIRIKSIRSRLLEEGFGYIKISQFQQQTGNEFRQALQTLHTAAGNGELKGLVIDLRYNPGGLLDASFAVANCFIGDDIKQTAIVSIKGREPASNKVFNATVGNKEPRYPIVVLINGGSASASEIVAGALQDHKRAIVMGTQSFGKGSVQTIFPLKGDAALKLTTARYYTPNGRSIQAKGIVPDIEVSTAKPMTVKKKSGETHEKDLENRLEPDGKTVEKQPEQPTQSTQPASPHRSQSDLDTANDYQLMRALDLLKSLGMLKEKGV
ncbi:MAG TPA: S41 family peptidase [Desulfuromonadales bacterium]|nr:S41 family peptidase [Desulfuromonadales bacterium]